MWWFCCCAAAPLHFERSLWSRLGMCRKGAGRGQGAHGLCQHRPNIMHFYVARGGMEYGVPCGPQPPSPPMSHCSHPSGLICLVPEPGRAPALPPHTRAPLPVGFLPVLFDGRVPHLSKRI